MSQRFLKRAPRYHVNLLSDAIEKYFLLLFHGFCEVSSLYELVSQTMRCIQYLSRQIHSWKFQIVWKAPKQRRDLNFVSFSYLDQSDNVFNNSPQLVPLVISWFENYTENDFTNRSWVRRDLGAVGFMRF